MRMIADRGVGQTHRALVASLLMPRVIDRINFLRMVCMLTSNVQKKKTISFKTSGRVMRWNAGTGPSTPRQLLGIGANSRK